MKKIINKMGKTFVRFGGSIVLVLALLVRIVGLVFDFISFAFRKAYVFLDNICCRMLTDKKGKYSRF